jgi:hypothetical protein
MPSDEKAREASFTEISTGDTRKGVAEAHVGLVKERDFPSN